MIHVFLIMSLLVNLNRLGFSGLLGVGSGLLVADSSFLLGRRRSGLLLVNSILSGRTLVIVFGSFIGFLGFFRRRGRQLGGGLLGGLLGRFGGRLLGIVLFDLSLGVRIYRLEKITR